MKERVNCCTAGCDICSNSVCVGKSLLGDDLYRCRAHSRKHKKIDARDCNAFRCNEPIWHLCEKCRKGK